MMRTFIATLCVLLFAAFGFAQDLLIMNGRVIDGTGKARVLANVRVRDGKIAEIGPVKPAAGETTLDVKGMLVTPGFVDLQSLSPAAIEKDPAATPLLTQGVTTAILGADGTGPYLVEEFMLPFDEKPAGLNLAMLVGHAAVRRQIMGPDYKRPATADEIQRMGALVTDAMTQGAFGLGSDLQQEPCVFSTPDEVMALAKATARFGGTLLLRLRNETEKLADSVKEAVALAREAKIPVQVLTASKTAIAQIEKARSQRVDIAADAYSFTQLSRDKAVSIERAVQRMSATPASRMSLRERGVLKKGAPADIVVFDPVALSAGMKYVLVNGAMVVKDGQPTGARAGQALR
jgi:N-acyl-D-amino-acid deacylase